MKSISLNTYEIPCPKCGRILEFFSDEIKRRCKCGTVVYRENQPTCAEWCPFAAECLSGILPLEQIEELKRRREGMKQDENVEFFEKIKELCQSRGLYKRDLKGVREGGDRTQSYR
jgi:hypothetical protein